MKERQQTPPVMSNRSSAKVIGSVRKILFCGVLICILIPSLCLGEVVLIKTYTFEQDTEGWVISGQVSDITTPSFHISDGMIGLSPNGNENTYGFWRNDPNDISIQAGKDYAVDFYVSSDEIDRMIVPDMRLLVMSEDAQTVSGFATAFTIARNTSPLETSAFEPLIYTVKFTAARDIMPAFNGMQLYFEVMNFSLTDSSTATIFLHEVRVYGIDLETPTPSPSIPPFPTPTPQPTEIEFEEGIEIAVAGAPIALGTGDFNNDGHEDLAVVSWDNSNITVLLGDGIGGFVFASTSAVTATPNSLRLITADFNQDGNLDMAIGTSTGTEGPHSIGVLLGNGDGTFLQTDQTHSAPWEPRRLQSGDMNNDEIPDIVVVGIYAEEIWVLLGIGDGTFGTPITLSMGVGPDGLALADFNNDGKP